MNPTPSPKCNLIYVTTASPEEAHAIGRCLVEERLVACAHVLPEMQSVFRWDGRVQEAREVLLLAKTTEAKVPDAMARIRELHSYECPCIMALPITAGHPPFLEWIREMVRQ